MAKLSICAAFLLAAVGGSYTVNARAADDMPTKPLCPAINAPDKSLVILPASSVDRAAVMRARASVRAGWGAEANRDRAR